MTARRCFAIALVAIAAFAPVSASADGQEQVLKLPAPVTQLPTFPGLGLRPDRRLVSQVPGPVTTREDVSVAVGGDGTPATVQLDEHLHIAGTGAYLIYERGPARTVAPLEGSLPPVLNLGTVLWQGFSPGSRDLAARLRLDAGLEAERLPLRVQLSFHPSDGGPAQPLKLGQAPGAGTVQLQLTNTTGAPRALPTGVAAQPELDNSLSTLRSAAHRGSQHPTVAYPLPVAGGALPAKIPAADVGMTTRIVTAPLRVVGSLSAPGATLSGPTVQAGHFNGVLTDTVTFALNVPAAGPVNLDLTAVPTLDERTLQTSSSDQHQRTDQLVDAAAAAARGAELSPYVGSDTKGPASTRFRYTISTEPPRARPAAPWHPHPVALGIVAFAGLALVGGAAAVWRRA